MNGDMKRYVEMYWSLAAAAIVVGGVVFVGYKTNEIDQRRTWTRCELEASLARTARDSLDIVDCIAYLRGTGRRPQRR